MLFWAEKGGIFKDKASETLDMTSEGLGEMFVGDFALADMCGKICSIVLIWGQAEGLVCADPGVRTSIVVSGISTLLSNLQPNSEWPTIPVF
jgi:hypothetical protein